MSTDRTLSATDSGHGTEKVYRLNWRRPTPMLLETLYPVQRQQIEEAMFSLLNLPQSEWPADKIVQMEDMDKGVPLFQFRISPEMRVFFLMPEPNVLEVVDFISEQFIQHYLAGKLHAGTPG